MQPSSSQPMTGQSYARTSAVLGGQYRKFFGASIAATLMLQATIVADTIIVGRLLGPVPMSGIRVASPVVNLLGVISTLVGVGGSTLAAIAIGRREREAADTAFTMAIVLGMVLGLAFALVVVPLSEPIARLISSSPETVEHTAAFMRIVAAGSPAYILASAMAMLLRADGCIRLSSVVLAAAGLVSVALDLVFMGPLGMGVDGSALATTMGMLTGVLLSLLYFRWPERTLRLRRPSWRGCGALVADIVKNGAPSSLRMLFACVSLLFLNYVVGRVVGVSGITVLTVCGNIQLLAVAFFAAGGQAAMPMEGVLYGERDFGGLRLLVSYALRVILACVAVIVVVAWLFPSQIIGLFVRGGIEGADSLLRIYVLGFVPMAVNYVLLYHFNTVQRRTMALVLTLCENLVLYLPLIWILTQAFGLVGAVSSFVCAEALTTVLTLCVAGVLRRRERLASLLLVPDVPREVVFEATVPATGLDASGIAHGVKGALDTCGTPPTLSVRAAMGVEEMVANAASYDRNAGRAVLFDVRVCALPDRVQVTLRDNGAPFDPTSYSEDERDEFAIEGIAAMRAVASSVEYRHALRLNQTVIEIREDV